MKKLILSGLLLAATTSYASDQVTQATEWTSHSLRLATSSRPTGDISRGKALNDSMMCSSCHGKEGLPPTNRWPAVAGQLESYTYKMLLDYQSGARSEDNRANIMTAVADLMSEQDMSDIAAYYASLPAPTLAQQSAPALVTEGDKDRLITACASCHGLSGQGGIKGTPAIAGQTAETLKRALEMYRSGDRDSDLYSVMRQASQRLTSSEIDSLANYYSGTN
ncbi:MULTISPECIES: cytochrome c [unclassified Marinobacterium]|uniref:c-type cytochrome n=1 Tax=unclassified Marinobacterium TaxID=2644139 RepID=UPI001569F6A2|nr:MULTISPECIES: c-type cytochrome [unclassified Marinobacterium]NRP14829.1 Cytochrome c4 precursor [Marinobacterium sp. xm-a-152]NRP36812.1 Cytochrome c4 precursor [Marinobacterium sp. xm-d-579]NRQ02029.1 Cytochrome c4 precursor [Marinobacterium sp. xm-d-530]